MKEYEYFFYNSKDEFVKSKRLNGENEGEANSKADNELRQSRGKLTDWLIVNIKTIK